jgi:hypothetical protein
VRKNDNIKNFPSQKLISYPTTRFNEPPRIRL